MVDQETMYAQVEQTEAALMNAAGLWAAGHAEPMVLIQHMAGLIFLLKSELNAMRGLLIPKEKRDEYQKRFLDDAQTLATFLNSTPTAQSVKSSIIKPIRRGH